MFILMDRMFVIIKDFGNPKRKAQKKSVNGKTKKKKTNRLMNETRNEKKLN